MLRTQTLDVAGFSKPKTSVSYPNFQLLDLSDITSVVLPLLEQGDIPVIAGYEGKRFVVGRISGSAYNVWRLLRTHTGLRYCPDENESILIQSIEDYLENV